MGNPNSKSSFKNNNSLASSINFLNSQQFSLNNSHGQANKDTDVLTKFTWKYGGNQVLLTGSFYRWKQTISLLHEGDQFNITILLPRGLHYYKFIVDGQWRFSPEDPSIPDNYGNINNCIDTTDFQPMTTNIKKKTQQRLKDRIEYKEVEQLAQTAPKVPPHYEYCDYLHGQIPKNPANQNKGNSICKMSSQIKQFEQSLNEKEVYELFNSQHCFRPPTHATVNHLIHEQASSYSSISMTQRFKSKYTTYRYFLRQGE